MEKIYFLTFTIFLLLNSCTTSEKTKTRNEIAEVFGSTASTNNLKKCYESALKKDLNTQGRIVINFKIDDQSNAKDIRVVEEGSTINDQELRTCLMNNVQSLKFPPAAKNDYTEVNFPFKLQKN